MKKWLNKQAQPLCNRLISKNKKKALNTWFQSLTSPAPRNKNV
jgi:hypothetical protein